MLNNLQNPIYQVTKMNEQILNIEAIADVNEFDIQETIPNEPDPGMHSELEADTEYLFHSPELLGWLSTEEQVFLFNIITAYAADSDSILDVGCGRGDLNNFLATKRNTDLLDSTSYTGIDYNPYIIDIGKQKWPGVNLLTADIYDEETLSVINDMSADWVVASGAFNYKVIDDMYSYVFKCVDNMMKYANKGVAINLMTDYYDETDEALVSQMFKYDATYVFQYLTSKYPKTVTRMDYMEGDVTFYILK